MRFMPLTESLRFYFMSNCEYTWVEGVSTTARNVVVRPYGVRGFKWTAARTNGRRSPCKHVIIAADHILARVSIYHLLSVKTERSETLIHLSIVFLGDNFADPAKERLK